MIVGAIAVAIIGAATFAWSWLLLMDGDAYSSSEDSGFGRVLRNSVGGPVGALRAAAHGDRAKAAEPTPAPSAAAAVDDEPASEATEVLPLDVLSPEAAGYAEALACCVWIAVLVPDDGVAYEFQGEETAPLISVAKVPIMLAYLDRVTEEGRDLTELEEALLDDMITLSDNAAATSLWEAMGGAAAMAAYLETQGIEGVETSEDSWGSTPASPLQMASLMAMLVQGDVLDEASREIAMGLLSSVDPSQDWGALAGTEGLAIESGLKNGWYPESWGWSTNSVAYVVPADQPAYAIAIFTSGWHSMADGIASIETIAELLNEAMLAGG